MHWDANNTDGQYLRNYMKVISNERKTFQTLMKVL